MFRSILCLTFLLLLAGDSQARLRDRFKARFGGSAASCATCSVVPASATPTPKATPAATSAPPITLTPSCTSGSCAAPSRTARGVFGFRR